MSTLLHVSNLGRTAAEYDLTHLFAAHGTVRQAAIHPVTGGETGTGTVEMECDADADTAIASLHGHDYRGQPLVVVRASGRQETNAAGTSMFESMNIPEASELGTTCGPRPGSFGDRGGKCAGERR